jgi:hypothetical protein
MICWIIPSGDRWKPAYGQLFIRSASVRLNVCATGAKTHHDTIQPPDPRSALAGDRCADDFPNMKTKRPPVTGPKPSQKEQV